MSHMIIDQLDQQVSTQDFPEFCVGDTVSVHLRIKEGNKERVQVFTGTVIAIKGSGIHKTFSLHRNAYGEGMERVFLLSSPSISKITIDRRGKVRRSKLYYLRGTSGKKARVKELIGRKKEKAPKKAKAKAPVEKKEEPVSEAVEAPAEESKPASEE